MLGIIGGSGLYALEGLERVAELSLETPFGPPSAPIIHGRLHGVDVLFLPRHGTQHQYLPHEVNYRANIYALKAAGAQRILAVSAVGSLREALAPGTFVLPDQYIDQVKVPRDKTYFGEGLTAHISTAEPVCAALQGVVAEVAQTQGLTVHRGGAYVCVDGPRLGTRAESHMWRVIGADIIGMTQVPEVFLAREACLSYASLCIVTDYDSWREDPSEHAQASAIFARFAESLGQVKALLRGVIAQAPRLEAVPRPRLDGAIMSKPETLSPQKLALLEALKR